MNAWYKLLEFAVHAPSPHNVQPWRVRILSTDRADLFIEKGRTLPKEDISGSFIILAMGLFIEALRILAANRSLTLRWELSQHPSQFTPECIAKTEDELLPFARLFLDAEHETEPGVKGQAGFGPSRYDDTLFLARRTSRISLLPRLVPDEAAISLSSLASEWGQSYEQVAVPETIERVVERNIEALFEDLNVPAYHDEIVEWFRFTDRASRRTRDGLDYRCMNSSRLSFWLAARFPNLLQPRITRPILQRVYRKQIGPVPTLGMLAGPFWEPENAFESGRFLMHFWLEVTKHDLYIHPFGNLVTNKPAAKWCRETLGVSEIWLIFKIGFSDVPPKSYRRSVEEVLLD